jgi:hypothetical protein
MSNDLKWMLSSDQQFPYQDDKMIALWFKVMKWFKPDVVDYLGDTDDQACYSKYTDGKPTEFLKAYKNDDVTNDLELMLKDMKIDLLLALLFVQAYCLLSEGLSGNEVLVKSRNIIAHL